MYGKENDIIKYRFFIVIENELKKRYTNLNIWAYTLRLLNVLTRRISMDKFAIKIKGIVKYHGKYLLVQKWYDDNIVNPYKWEFVDSILTAGERPEEAAIHNVHVHTGLAAKVEKIPYTWTYTVGDTEYVGIAFVCNAEEDIVILSDEYSNSIWVEEDELKNYIEDMLMLKDLHKYLGINIDMIGKQDEELELSI